MTDNWNALTDEEMGEITKALVEAVLKYEWCEHDPDTCDEHLHDCGVKKCTVDIDPLRILDHTALLWAALNKEQKVRVENRLMQTFTEGNQWVIGDIMLDPLKLSQAIYAVTVGKED